jgi:hypothetical protein
MVARTNGEVQDVERRRPAVGARILAFGAACSARARQLPRPCTLTRPFFQKFGRTPCKAGIEDARGTQAELTHMVSRVFCSPFPGPVLRPPCQSAPTVRHSWAWQPVPRRVFAPQRAGKRNMREARISLQSSRGGLGDETADLITTLIGVNALNEDETRNSLAIIRAAFEKPETIQPLAKNPTRTLLLLRHLADFTDQDSLKREIAETIAYVQAR